MKMEITVAVGLCGTNAIKMHTSLNFYPILETPSLLLQQMRQILHKVIPL